MDVGTYEAKESDRTKRREKEREAKTRKYLMEERIFRGRKAKRRERERKRRSRRSFEGLSPGNRDSKMKRKGNNTMNVLTSPPRSS
jgi:hypothetical protein